MDELCPICQTPLEVRSDPDSPGGEACFCPRCDDGRSLPGTRALDTPGGAPSAGSPGAATLRLPAPQALPGVDGQFPAELQFLLKVVEGGELGKVYEVTRSRVTVGREEGDIVIGDPLVSRKHAAFEIFGARHIVLKDLASTNGTFLNGRLIAFSKLNHGDRIRIGSTVLEAIIRTGL